MSMRAAGRMGESALVSILMALAFRLRWYALLPLMLAWSVLTLTGRGLRLLPRHPIVLAGLTAAWVVAYTNPVWLPSSVVLAAAVVWMWAQAHPASYRRHISPRLRGWKRATFHYRWGRPTWRKTMRRCHITRDGVPAPWLASVHSTPYVDKLRVVVPTGHDETAFQDFRGDLLQWGWRAESCRVFNPQPKRHTVELWNLIKDPLAEPVAPFTKPAEALPRAGWELALVEDGEPWKLNIRGGAAHMFVCGISGSGKGSVIGSLLDQAQTGIEDKTVRVWGVDPQASELGMWRHLFHKLVFTQADAADLLEELVEIMDKRTRKLFGIARQHHPTADDQFELAILDEGLDLLDKTDRKLYRRIDTALRQLLRKGRKASIAVVFMSQRAELDIVEIRKDFPNRVALKLAMSSDVDMVLGRGALAAGADAHEIIEPGVGYVATDQGIMRVRFPYLSDDYIRDLPQAPDTEPAELPDPSSIDHILIR